MAKLSVLPILILLSWGIVVTYSQRATIRPFTGTTPKIIGVTVPTLPNNPYLTSPIPIETTTTTTTTKRPNTSSSREKDDNSIEDNPSEEKIKYKLKK